MDIDGEVKEEFDFKVKPFQGELVEAGALRVNGMSLEDLRTFPEPACVYNQLIKIFDRYIDKYNRLDKFYLTGQNVPFDYDFMLEFFKKNNDNYLGSYIHYHKIDLIAITALFKLAGRLEGIENMKLVTLKQHFGIESKDHDALADIRATRKVFYKYLAWVR